MANFQKTLNEEIRRLARKEVKIALLPLKKKLKDYKARLILLKNEVHRLKGLCEGNTSPIDPLVDETQTEQPAMRLRKFSSKRIKSLRAKFDLSQAALAKLMGVSLNSVVNWENDNVKPRKIVYTKLRALSHMKKAAVHQLLEEINAGDKSRDEGE